MNRISTEDITGLTPDLKYSIVLTRSHITKNITGAYKSGYNNKRRKKKVSLF